MAQTEYTTTARLPVGTIWEFVQEMDNWAHLLTGYQVHEKQGERDSLWTLKGDVGVLARIVKFRVHVTEWNRPKRVRFRLEGLNELLEGEGEFSLESAEEGEAAAPAAKGLLARWIRAVFRFFFRLRHGGVDREAPAAGAPGVVRLTFRLRLDPGGPMAPMIDAMMSPAMGVAAEDLASRIIVELEKRHGAS